MELFSEIYSAYYTVVSQILSESEISESDIYKLIQKNAFSESALYLVPKLKNEWKLMNVNGNIYSSNLKNSYEMPFTTLQKRWLKSLVSDSRIQLFADEDDIKKISEYLSDVEPLYKNEHFLFFDRFTDGDDFKNPEYIKNFKMIHKAINEKRIMKFIFKTSKEKEKLKLYIPIKLEYSPKNDKFRVYCGVAGENHISDTVLVNISRIISVEETDNIYNYDIDVEKLLNHRRCKEPVCIEVSSERNGVERFMMEFAGYEKRTEFDEKTKKCIAYIWYNTQDETELLIRLLSFGPVLEIKSPENFRNSARERIVNQIKILNTNGLK